MAYEIDTDKLNDPSLQILDIGKPPVRQMAHQSYPKMLYLHPKDKSKTHRTTIVHTPDEQSAHEAKGWKTKQHIPVEPAEDLSEHFEAEPLVPARNDRDPLDSMTKDELLAEAARRGITSVDGRNSQGSIIAALKAEPIAA